MRVLLALGTALAAANFAEARVLQAEPSFRDDITGPDRSGLYDEKWSSYWNVDEAEPEVAHIKLQKRAAPKDDGVSIQGNGGLLPPSVSSASVPIASSVPLVVIPGDLGRSNTTGNHSSDTISSSVGGKTISGAANTPIGSATGTTPGYIGAGSHTKQNGQPVNCSNIDEPFDVCWDLLNVTGYVVDWAESADCSYRPGFANCWLTTHHRGGYDCETIGIDKCSTMVPDDGEDIRVSYVNRNIFGESRMVMLE